MVWIFIWDTAPSKIYVWWSEVASVWAWDTKVRPTYIPRTFTISWTEQSNMSSWWTYSDDAAWLTAGSGTFDDFFGYSAVLLNTSGVETAEMTQSWWVFTGAMTSLGNITSGDNVMIKFPVRWIKMTKSWSVVTLSITDELNKAWYQYFAHTSSWTITSPWTVKDAFYLGAYKWYTSWSVLKSWSWQSPTTSQRQSVFCTQAKANSNRYNIIGFYQRQYINALYMMKYWNPNSQSKIWQWYTWWGSKINTWWTNAQTSATYWTSSSTTQCKLFWLEDRWGNVYEWVGGTYTNNSRLLYTTLSWYSWTLGWWTSTWTTIDWWADLASISGNNNAMFAPLWTVDNSSYNTYYWDLAFAWASSLAIAWWYYHWWMSSISWEAWAFTLEFSYGATSSSWLIWSRLMCF